MQRKMSRFVAAVALTAGLLTSGLATDAFAGASMDGGFDPERTSFELAGEQRQYGGTD